MLTYCRPSREQPKQETGDTSTTQISPSTSEQTRVPQSDGVYAEIEATPRINDLYNNLAPQKNNNYENTGAVIYSELQHQDSRPIDHTVSPSGDLYAQVQKH